MGRPNWYYDHPPACTCAQCNDRRLNPRPLAIPARRRPQRTSPLPRFRWVAVFSVLGLAIVATAVAYLGINEGWLRTGQSPSVSLPPVATRTLPSTTPPPALPAATTLSVASATPTPTARLTPTARPTPTPTPISRLRTIHNTQNMRWLAQSHPSLYRRLAGLPWVEDGLTDMERDAIDGLLYMAVDDLEVVAAIIPMPFLQVLDLTDVLALRSIRRLASDGALAALVEHPVFQDGISEDETPLVAAVGTMSERPGEVSRMLDPGYASIESFSIATPLSQIVLVSIVSVGDDADFYAADAIADAGPFVEREMLLPLPVEHLILVLHDSAVTGGAAGTNHGFAFGYVPKYDQPPDTYKGLNFLGGIVHEITHYYWSGNEGWIDEGLANTIEHMHGISNGLSPGQLRTRRKDCEAHDLEMLSEWDPPIGDSRYECNYYLGERLFLELREGMEDAEFSERLRELYQLTLGGQGERRNLGIAEVRQVFAGQAAIVDKHWSGALNAPENRPFDEGVDRTSHDLIQWDQHPTSAGHPEITVTFKGTLLNDAVLSKETNAEASQGEGYSNFTLYPANDSIHSGSILPPLNDGRRTWTLDDPGDNVAGVYELHDRSFTVKLTFPPALGSPSGYVVVVWGFPNETRTPTVSDTIDILGYARIRGG